MRTLFSIQAMRAVAAIAVVISHCYNKSILQAGVDIFFIISGFIMWTIISKPTDVLDFWRHRLIRVVPLYWLATMAMAWHQNATFVPFVQSMLFIPFFNQGQIWPVLIPGWTINYEIAFYALIGVIILVRPSMRFAAIWVILVSASGLHGFVSSDNAPLLVYTDPIMLEFLAGVVLAELYLRRWLASFEIAWLYFGCSVVWFSSLDINYLPESWDRLWAWGLPSFMLVSSVLTLEIHGQIAKSKWLQTLGDASYAIYLSHTFLVGMVFRVYTGRSPALRDITFVLVAILFGLIVHFAVELPLTKFLRRL